MGTESDITRDEKETLERGEHYMPTRDEAYLQQATMDNTDFEGESLNERSFGDDVSGADLDTATVGDETYSEALGQGDEENKHYSLGSDENDSSENKQ